MRPTETLFGRVQQKGTSCESKVHIIEGRLLWLEIAIAIAHILKAMAIARKLWPPGLPGQACSTK